MTDLVEIRTLQFASLFRAGALVQQALDVIGEHTVIAQHRLDADVVVLLLVLLGGHGGQHNQQNDQFHGDGFEWRIELHGVREINGHRFGMKL